jgi:tripartite-type tricarboxylate transporter receptor subunit TctC
MKPINMIVPFNPGGSSDLVGRTVAKVSTKYLGQPMVILNKPGAAATLGLNMLVESRPDGYTIGITNSGMILQPLVGSRYNYATELQALAQAGFIPFVFAVRADAPWKDLAEFTAYAKQHPGAIKYGHTGIGNTAHSAPEHYAKLAGLKMDPIPFTGGSPLIAALLGGHIHAIMNNPVDLQQHIKAGKIRVLAVADEKRIAHPQYTNVPTFKEFGYPVNAILWQGLGGPKNLPPDVLKPLADGLKAMMNDPETKKAIEDLGLIFEYLGPEEFGKKWVDEQARLKEVLTETGILEQMKSQKK